MPVLGRSLTLHILKPEKILYSFKSSNSVSLNNIEIPNVDNSEFDTSIFFLISTDSKSNQTSQTGLPINQKVCCSIPG